VIFYNQNLRKFLRTLGWLCAGRCLLACQSLLHPSILANCHCGSSA